MPPVVWGWRCQPPVPSVGVGGVVRALVAGVVGGCSVAVVGGVVGGVVRGGVVRVGAGVVVGGGVGLSWLQAASVARATVATMAAATGRARKENSRA